MKRLADKVAIITGGSAGIGKATAEKFAQEGAHIAIWDVAEEKGKQLALSLETYDIKASFFKVDTSQQAQVDQAAQETLEQFGKADILVNNAGITRDASFLKMTHEQWEQVININLTGVYNCTKAIAPHMVSRNFGRILNASSVVGLYGNFGQTNYAATKAGVIAMTQTWARELGRKGITVNAVAPGFISTEMVALMPDTVLEGMKAKVPLGRLGTPGEVAALYAFLASDEAAYINGATISIDGGITL
jgi:3-oxoacyl-[acyl-carrier protein] reductase